MQNQEYENSPKSKKEKRKSKDDSELSKEERKKRKKEKKEKKEKKRLEKEQVLKEVQINEVAESIDKKEDKVSKVDTAAWLKENDIVITDPKEEKHEPIFTFEETGLSADLLKTTQNFSKPTPIQSCCWPILLKGRDIIGIAETGSGKTLAFGLPAFSHLQKSKPSKKPKVLILSPTRELALQIHEHCEKASEFFPLSSICIFGGVPKDQQVQQLRKGVQLIVACPGRLLDLVEEGNCHLDQIDYVVLDEADRMLDMGFEKEVVKIMKLTKPSAQRQMIMFSATWPTSIQKLAHQFLKEPVKVTVGSPELGANAIITQIVQVLDDPRDKENQLLELLKKYHSTRQNKVLVFALYKKEAARLEQFLLRKGYQCVAIHGDMNQTQRNQSFSQFKSGKVPLLIATDVAARGLDIPNVEYVINFTFPLTIEDYVHRIGRTGRAGKKGLSHTFFTFQEKAKSGELINLLKQTNQNVPDNLLAFGTTVKKKEHSAYGAFFKEVDTKDKPTKIVFGSDDEE